MNLQLILYEQILLALIEYIEDAEDLAAIERYKPEESIPFDTIVAKLKRDGKL